LIAEHIAFRAIEGGAAMANFLSTIGLAAVLVFGLAHQTKAACGDDCDTTYSSDVDSCHIQYGDDPQDADELLTCTRDAKDGYDSCLDECKN
jgi:hypothetical protein